jgi:hypothetical protein
MVPIYAVNNWRGPKLVLHKVVDFLILAIRFGTKNKIFNFQRMSKE